MEIPPVSKVIPLPTIHGEGPGLSGFISKITMQGLRSLPIPTPTNPPIPRLIASS